MFRGCETMGGARRFCQTRGLLRNLRQRFYRLGATSQDENDAIQPPLVRVREALTTELLAAKITAVLLPTTGQDLLPAITHPYIPNRTGLYLVLF